MEKVEVEHRGLLTKEKFDELSLLLKEKGKFFGEKKRFSLIFSPSREEESYELNRSPIDLKVRITNGKVELVLKYGSWSGNDARKEFLFSIEPKKMEEIVEFLFILGYYFRVLQATTTKLYLYNEVEFALVKVPGWGYYFEAEIATNSNEIEKGNKKIIKECQKLGIAALDDKNFCKMLDDLNNRPGHRFNLKKEKFFDIKKRFIDYF